MVLMVYTYYNPNQEIGLNESKLCPYKSQFEPQQLFKVDKQKYLKNMTLLGISIMKCYHSTETIAI